jgi:hypothetical protein
MAAAQGVTAAAALGEMVAAAEETAAGNLR